MRRLTLAAVAAVALQGTGAAAAPSVIPDSVGSGGMSGNSVRQEPVAPVPLPLPVSPANAEEPLEVYPDDDQLRPGRPMFGLELTTDCSVRYRGAMIQPRSANEYGQDGHCEYLPRILRSPSGRWVALHSPLDNYGYGRLALVDAGTQTVALRPKALSAGMRLFPLDAWSTDESLLLMKDVAFLGPAINDLYQLTVEQPCVVTLPAGALRCVDRTRFVADLQAATLRASPLSRCLPGRTCYLAMAIRDVRPDGDGFAVTGVVQLKRVSADVYSVDVTESFEPREDIEWFELSARVSGAAAMEDMVLTVGGRGVITSAQSNGR